MTNNEIKTLITEANYRLNANVFTVQIDYFENDDIVAYQIGNDFLEEVTCNEASNWIADMMNESIAKYKIRVTVYDYEAEAGSDGEVIFNQVN